MVVVLKERRCSQYSSNKILDTKVTYEPLISDFNDQKVKRIYDPLGEQVGSPTFTFGPYEAGSWPGYSNKVGHPNETGYSNKVGYSIKVRYSNKVLLRIAQSRLLNVWVAV